jgi:hypothetical protein
MKTLFAIVVTIIAAAEAFGSDGQFIERSIRLPDHLFIDLGHNSVSNINSELADSEVRSIAAEGLAIDVDTASMPEFRLKRYRFVCTRNGTDPTAIEPLALRMHWYAASRAQGHSREYALAALRERGTNLFSNPSAPREIVLHQHQDVPPSWLKQRVKGDTLSEKVF